MFFDNLAGIVERHLPDLIGVMAGARMFRMDGRGVKPASEAIESWKPDQRTIENFKLPFATIAFEETENRHGAATSCAVFWTVNEAERVLGFLVAQGQKRDTFVTTGKLKALPNVEQEIAGDDMANVGAIQEIAAWRGTKKAGLSSVTINPNWLKQFKVPESSPNRELFNRVFEKYDQGDPTWEDDLEKAKEHLADLRGEVNQLDTSMAYMRCCLGVLSILIVNEPATFIVEETPLCSRSGNPNNTIRRSEGRPHYIVLKPREIRRRFLTVNEHEPDDEERRKVAPHERRGHYRRLQSERFKAARGRVLWVNAMWVGPSEVVRGTNRYRVRLDL